MRSPPDFVTYPRLFRATCIAPLYAAIPEFYGDLIAYSRNDTLFSWLRMLNQRCPRLPRSTTQSPRKSGRNFGLEIERQMRAVGRPGYADQHHAVGALGIGASEV